MPKQTDIKPTLREAIVRFQIVECGAKSERREKINRKRERCSHPLPYLFAIFVTHIFLRLPHNLIERLEQAIRV